VVPVYELGTFGDARPYFTMKLVRGRTLAQLLADRASADDDRPRFLAMFLQVAQTIAYAHARGVIHRDLKPSNIMVGSFGEVQVMDWGLAKVLPKGNATEAEPPTSIQETIIATIRSEDDSDHSKAGNILGTPSYMAPEQARGEVDRIDRRADVFALGAILCEILTGRPAILGRGSYEIVHKAAMGDLTEAFARLKSTEADADLIQLTIDCLAPEPEDRPTDAQEVADRLLDHRNSLDRRLREAELAQAAEYARAEEAKRTAIAEAARAEAAEAQTRAERRARRLQLGLAASMIGLMALGVGGYAWIEQQRARRIVRTARTVEEALSDVDHLRGDALAASAEDRLTRWDQALSAAKRAEDALNQGEADAPLRDRVATVFTQISRQRSAAEEKARSLKADRELLTALESIRGNRAEHWDARRTDADYAAAFRKAGLDLDQTDPAGAGHWIAARSAPTELSSYLDEWALIRRNADRPQSDWRRLLAVAMTADPDPWRQVLREKAGKQDESSLAELRRLADDEKTLDRQSAGSLVLLAIQLKDDPADRDRAARVLRRAVSNHPDDFWAHFILSSDLGVVAGPLGHTYLRPEESVRHLTAAIAIRPGSSPAHDNLGSALRNQGKLEEAVSEFRHALRLSPESSMGHFDLGNALQDQGKLEEAVSEFRQALRLDPDHMPVHNNLGAALRLQGHLDEAVSEFRQALRINPESSEAHNNLGLALWDQGHLDEAVSEYRQALRINPDYSDAHNNLGVVLRVQGHLDEAVSEFRQALRINHDSSETHCSLAFALRMLGDYPGSLAEFRLGHEIGSRQAGWKQPSAEWVAEAEVLVALANRLPNLLAGKEEPKDSTERLAFAQLCYDTKRFAAAAGFWANALAADPKLGNDRRVQHRYNAACAAALAGSGQGKDDPAPDEPARIGLRRQALDWLNAELAVWTKVLDSGPAQARPVIVQTLQHWQTDTDLAGLRDPEAVAKLPEGERAAWRSLWEGVEALKQKAGAARP
jgi:tetratricopeptide (TPR) repeat protein